MSYSQSVYKALRSYEVPHKIALALADSSSPIALKSTVGANVTATAAPAALALDADLPTAVLKINALRTALIASGVLT